MAKPIAYGSSVYFEQQSCSHQNPYYIRYSYRGVIVDIVDIPDWPE